MISKFFCVLMSLSVFLFFLISGCSLPSITDIQAINDSTLYAGEGEICKNKFVNLECDDGLKCVPITTSPEITKVCFPKNETVVIEPDDYNLPHDILLNLNESQNITTTVKPNIKNSTNSSSLNESLEYILG